MTAYLDKFMDFSAALPMAGSAWDPDSRGYVYVIGFDEPGIVKIGSASAPPIRLAELQVGNPFELRLLAAVSVYVGDPVIIEFAAHRLCEDFRIRGEWFDMGERDALRAIIKACRNKKAKFGSVNDAYLRAFPPQEVAEDERRQALRMRLGMT